MYIVTGAAGFIGSVICEQLNKRYPDTGVVAVDWMGHDTRWKNLNARQLTDIIFPESLMDYLEENARDITAVIHMGAISATVEVNVDDLMEKNFGYTMDLFRWCADNDKPFIYASSAATYGNGEMGFEDSEDVEFLNQLRPLNAYGFSKNMADKAMQLSSAQPPQCVGLKFFNVYGPNEYHKGRMASMVYHSTRQVQDNGKVRLFKSDKPEFRDGEQSRDFVYVKDCGRAVTWLLDHPQVSGIFNMGTGEARSFNDLTHAVFAAMNTVPNIEYFDMPADLKGQYQYLTEANMDKFQDAYAEFGDDDGPFRFTSLEDGVRDYVQNYLLADSPYL